MDPPSSTANLTDRESTCDINTAGESQELGLMSCKPGVFNIITIVYSMCLARDDEVDFWIVDEPDSETSELIYRRMIYKFTCGSYLQQVRKVESAICNGST